MHGTSKPCCYQMLPTFSFCKDNVFFRWNLRINAPAGCVWPMIIVECTAYTTRYIRVNFVINFIINFAVDWM